MYICQNCYTFNALCWHFYSLGNFFTRSGLSVCAKALHAIDQCPNEALNVHAHSLPVMCACSSGDLWDHYVWKHGQFVIGDAAKWQMGHFHATDVHVFPNEIFNACMHARLATVGLLWPQRLSNYLRWRYEKKSYDKLMGPSDSCIK